MFGLEEMISIASVDLILSGLSSGTLLYMYISCVFFCCTDWVESCCPSSLYICSADWYCGGAVNTRTTRAAHVGKESRSQINTMGPDWQVAMFYIY